jgi:hypothetical protein
MNNIFPSYFSLKRKVTKVQDLKLFERKTNEACPACATLAGAIRFN